LIDVAARQQHAAAIDKAIHRVDVGIGRHARGIERANIADVLLMDLQARCSRQ
jgi:hypothetical protein